MPLNNKENIIMKYPIQLGSCVVQDGKASTAHVGSAELNKVGKNPLLLFTLGIVAGVYIYKHRHDINAIENHSEPG